MPFALLLAPEVILSIGGALGLTAAGVGIGSGVFRAGDGLARNIVPVAVIAGATVVGLALVSKRKGLYRLE